MSCVRVIQRGHSSGGCDLLSTVCKYNLRKGDSLKTTSRDAKPTQHI